jgi:hypothetical protein
MTGAAKIAAPATAVEVFFRKSRRVEFCTVRLRLGVSILAFRRALLWTYHRLSSRQSIFGGRSFMAREIQTVLGIDMGTESVGSAWVDLTAKEFDFAVSVFPRGVEKGDEQRGATAGAPRPNGPLRSLTRPNWALPSRAFR